ncbi:oligosaccharide flippase family protein [Fontivita pretiosa]|uniref:oligosaccharide flippase family protein n=1 Tax=Fontivita pretiosa TaxID=2989684 RepID=UPI003D17F4AD
MTSAAAQIPGKSFFLVDCQPANVQAATPQPSLKQLAIRGAVWTVAGYGASQLLRLGGNLVLTRLLFPEAFGLMALVGVFMQGLAMFSDVGIGPAIIQSRRGEDPDFLNTAWTIQIIRGFVLWLISCLIAWPVAVLYGEPMLVQLLPVAGMTAAIRGFQTTAVSTASRRLCLGNLTLVQLLEQSIGITAMLIWSVVHPSVWALAGSGVISSFVSVLLQFRFLPGHGHRISLEADALRHLLRFGKWIFVSTVMSFLIAQADRLVVAHLSNTRTLGLFAIAATLCSVPLTLALQLSANVVFAGLSRSRIDAGRGVVRERSRKFCLAAFSALLPIILLLFAASDRIVSILYDQRYAEAAPLLRLLCIGAVGTIVTNLSGAPLLALGDSRSQAILQIVRGGLFLSATGIGVGSNSLEVFLVALAIARCVEYLPAAVMLRRAGVWNPGVDVSFLGGYLAAMACFWASQR